MAGAEVVLITGCSDGGIGSALVKAFHTRGCIVYATARNLDSMPRFPTGVHVLQLDVCNAQSIEAAVQQVVREQGRIDVLLNNAGIGHGGPVAESDMEGVKQVFDTNVLGLLAVTQALVPHMAERRSGKIINFGSIAGAVAMPLTGVYCSAKAAVHSLTHVLRVELAPFNIQVMLLVPGTIYSNIWDRSAKVLELAQLKVYAQYLSAFNKQFKEAHAQPKTPTDVFAKQVAEQVLRPRLRRQYWCGSMTSVVWTISWFPLWLRDLFLAYRFGFERPAEPYKAKAE